MNNKLILLLALFLPCGAQTVVINGWGGSTIGVLKSSSHVEEVPIGTQNGSNKTFNLSFTPSPAHLILVLNGVVQSPFYDYTLNGATITYTVAPKATDHQHVEYFH